MRAPHIKDPTAQMPRLLRAIAAPFVVAPPAGGRIRTRLGVSAVDEMVLCQVGEYLDRLAGGDLAERCGLGLGDSERFRRKRALIRATSSRWAGTISRSSDNQWQRAYRNLLDQRAGLRRAIGRLRARLTAPVGGRSGRVRGYASQDERWQKQRRLDLLTARLAYLANRPHGRYRLSCPVRFSYRTDAWAAQVASGPVRYDIAYQPERDRWYLEAS
jgi:hypothetical protein